MYNTLRVTETGHSRINEFPDKTTDVLRTSKFCKTLDIIFRSSHCRTDYATTLIYSILSYLNFKETHIKFVWKSCNSTMTCPYKKLHIITKKSQNCCPGLLFLPVLPDEGYGLCP